MHIHEIPSDWKPLVAQAADICLKPLKYSVVDKQNISKGNLIDEPIELLMHIYCRTAEGVRVPSGDLELEIFTSGNDLNLILSWLEKPNSPILWHGKHSVWMDCNDGKKCDAPSDGEVLESLARRLRAIFNSLN